MTQSNRRSRPVRVTRAAALILLGLGCLIASAGCFAASYLGCFQWASAHGLAGWRAYHWPVAADVLMAVGELALLVAIIDEFTDKTITWLGAVLTTVGLGVSVAANVGAAPGGVLWHITWALFPAVAALTFAAGLLVLRSVISKQPAHQARPAADTASIEGPKREPSRKHPAGKRRPAVPRADKQERAEQLARELARTADADLPSAASLALRIYGDRRWATTLLADRRKAGMAAL